MSNVIPFRRHAEDAPQPSDGDGGGTEEVVIRVILEFPDDPGAEADPESETEPVPEEKGGSWVWFALGALLGLGVGG